MNDPAAAPAPPAATTATTPATTPAASDASGSAPPSPLGTASTSPAMPDAAAPMIEMAGVTKRYGNLVALDDLSLRLDQGDAFGFIGPNGAGKSTTMKILACLLRPDTGIARVCGLDCAVDGRRIRRLIGYMPDFLGVYPDLKVHEYLEFFASAYSVPRRERRRVVGDVLELTDLVRKRDDLVDSLSRGMQQRLGVARVLIHDPKVLLLDEPASGLDPRARIEIRSLLLELRRMGKTIMISSHILSELHEMCNQIGIIEQGRLLYSGSIEEAIRRTGLHGGLELAVDDPDRALVVLRQMHGIAKVEREGPKGVLVTIEDVPLAPRRAESGEAATTTGDAAPSPPPPPPDPDAELLPPAETCRRIARAVVEAGIGLEAMRPREVKLEDVFLRLTRGEVN